VIKVLRVVFVFRFRILYDKVNMRFVPAAFAASMVGSAIAHPGSPHPDAQGRYTLEAEGIKAQFIPYAATLTNLWVAGKLIQSQSLYLC
jgi:aldose 1-epimerase